MVCAGCGSKPQTGRRQQRRIESAGRSAEWRCETCRGLRRAEPSDAAYSFWADRFGVAVPPGATARSTLEAAVLASAAPPELARLLEDLR